jgi:hypothetical protein
MNKDNACGGWTFSTIEYEINFFCILLIYVCKFDCVGEIFYWPENSYEII